MTCDHPSECKESLFEALSVSLSSPYSRSRFHFWFALRSVETAENDQYFLDCMYCISHYSLERVAQIFKKLK